MIGNRTNIRQINYINIIALRKHIYIFVLFFITIIHSSHSLEIKKPSSNVFLALTCDFVGASNIYDAIQLSAGPNVSVGIKIPLCNHRPCMQSYSIGAGLSMLFTLPPYKNVNRHIQNKVKNSQIRVAKRVSIGKIITLQALLVNIWTSQNAIFKVNPYVGLSYYRAKGKEAAKINKWHKAHRSLNSTSKSKHIGLFVIDLGAEFALGANIYRDDLINLYIIGKVSPSFRNNNYQYKIRNISNESANYTSESNLLSTKLNLDFGLSVSAEFIL